MIEIARILAGFSLVLLIVAMTAWTPLFRRPALLRLAGRARSIVGKVEAASQLLFLAVGLGAVAALLAIVGWITT